MTYSDSLWNEIVQYAQDITQVLQQLGDARLRLAELQMLREMTASHYQGFNTRQNSRLESLNMLRASGIEGHAAEGYASRMGSVLQGSCVENVRSAFDTAIQRADAEITDAKRQVQIFAGRIDELSSTRNSLFEQFNEVREREWCL